MSFRKKTNNYQGTKPFPKPIKLIYMLGPSFLILAGGLGTGEIILWPLLASEFGLGLIWLAVIGITFQYFINMEIERYTLVTGESVFLGVSKLFPKSVYWFFFSTFIVTIIPGTATAAAKLFAYVGGFDSHRWLAISFVVLMGLILSLSRTVYGMMENLTKVLIGITVPATIVIVAYISSQADWIALAQGLVGQGEGYSLIPPGIAIATLLGAFAYSGTGGNFNLTQSLFIKEEGYGMGKYSKPIKGLLNEEGLESVELRGYKFKKTKENMERYALWWKRISIEHLIVFWGIGLLMIVLLMMLAYITVNGMAPGESIDFIIIQSQVLGSEFTPLLGTISLFVIGLLLLQSQLSLYDSGIRMMAESYTIADLNNGKDEVLNLSKLYHMLLWSMVAVGILLLGLGFDEPRALIILGAVLNAVAMFAHIGLVNWTNHKLLDKEFQAPLWRKGLMVVIFIIYGFFSITTLINEVPKLF